MRIMKRDYNNMRESGTSTWLIYSVLGERPGRQPLIFTTREGDLEQTHERSAEATKRKTKVAIMNAVHDLPVLVARDKATSGTKGSTSSS